MSCAACARSIENQLSGTPGVATAHVNFATSTATVEFDPARTAVRDLVGRHRRAGLRCPPTQPRNRRGCRRSSRAGAGYSAPTSDAYSCASDPGLSVPVVALGMWPGLMQLRAMSWIQLALAAPVICFAGAPFFKDAWIRAAPSLRENMNTLISLGTGAAFLYSLVATVRGGHQVYYEAAADDRHLILLGRHARSRARAWACLGSHTPPAESCNRRRGARGFAMARSRIFRSSRCSSATRESMRPGEKDSRSMGR